MGRRPPGGEAATTGGRRGRGSSGCQASKAKSGEGRPAIFGGTELDETTANIPSWLRPYKDKTRIRLTCSGTSLQADAACRRPKFAELSATNLKILCDALELRVPRHRNIVPGISSTLLGCRSGVTRRRAGANPFGSSSSTWLLFLGRDDGGKMTVARDLARLVFGSYIEFTTLQVQGSPDISARTGKHALKRPRSPENDGDIEGRLFEAIMENPHRVILIDGIDRLNRESEMRIKNTIVGAGIARGRNGGVVSLEDAIVVLSASDSLEWRYMASSSSPWPRVKRRFNGQHREEGDAAGRSRCHHGWDLNFHAVDGEEEDNLANDQGILNVVDGVFLFN
ncbi:protein SMAX1-LIKE 3-like [Triticum aestivum]|uniref:protein SMAX1-LIKE 3-like n=1 Tax=Triticum aestivum TaxID=4565 RepID=UPI001D0196DE|nr:protein SMAX1-LIKE 3-like [Triticum aestivum]